MITMGADDTSLRISGKPEVDGKRRVAVGLARGADIEDARAKVNANPLAWLAINLQFIAQLVACRHVQCVTQL